MESILSFVNHQNPIPNAIDRGEYIQNTHYPVSKVLDRKEVVHSNIYHHNTTYTCPYILHFRLYGLKQPKITSLRFSLSILSTNSNSMNHAAKTGLM